MRAKSRHGGTRPGAGRPPSGEPTLRTVAIRILPNDLALVDAAATAEGSTRSEWVREAVMTAVARGSSR